MERFKGKNNGETNCGKYGLVIHPDECHIYASSLKGILKYAISFPPEIAPHSEYIIDFVTQYEGERELIGSCKIRFTITGCSER